MEQINIANDAGLLDKHDLIVDRLKRVIEIDSDLKKPKHSELDIQNKFEIVYLREKYLKVIQTYMSRIPHSMKKMYELTIIFGDLINQRVANRHSGTINDLKDFIGKIDSKYNSIQKKS
jgi:hypothetical protein